VQSRWSDAEARACVERYAGRGVGEDLALRVYTSRLIGADPSLVLHGGGNTSVKTRLADDTGVATEVLCVKGSGWDLASIEPEGLPAVRLEPLLSLRARESLSDEEMVNAQRTRLLDAAAPNPSVETLLHAFLPHKFIDHSHADAILCLVDQPQAEAICRDVFGARLAIVPYVMPGFALARLAADVFESEPSVEGLLLLRHGLFTFGASARESYERHVAAVDAAEARVRRGARTDVPAAPERAVPAAPAAAPELALRDLLPILRGRLGDEGRRSVLHVRATSALRAFADDPRLADLSQRGVATPDHVIRTKRLPLVLDPRGLDAAGLARHVAERVAAYRDAYRAYVARQTARRGIRVTPLDPDPRVVLVPGLGAVCAGPDEKSARVAADLAEHTVDVIRGAEAVGRYAPLGEDDLFDMEYWSLEQAKLGRSAAPPLAGRVVYVTGAASGIGAATARRLARAGAHLVLVDREAAPLEALARELGCACEAVDVTDEAAVRASVDRAVLRFGGLDGCVSNAGTAPQGAIADVATGVLEASLRVNLLAHQFVASAVVRVLRLQGMGGFLLFNASKAAFNPGPDFGPYAVPKAALVALMKQYALEGGAHGIRANAVNADRVRTGLLPEAMVRERAAARGLAPDDYFRSNLLRREVTADDVAQAFLALALAESTTGAVLTVDGGNIAASPR
jgi:rhamnose utilization protein RhaD (predicted bifunctional aldolase and dehydrogenase)/NAD(P)-dependent dehydrogenase (short-subunit alcohol dehydrogenase family)